MERALGIVYGELRALASVYLCRERPDHTLQPTALVHEAYVKLLGQHSVGWSDRQAFFAAASTIMRRILVDHARGKKAKKRGGESRRTVLDEAAVSFQERAIDLVALDEAMERLREKDEQKCRVVELRFFGGLTMQEVSDLLDVPLRTVEREWAMARAWLRGELAKA